MKAIYQILNKVNGKFYIGSSKKVEQRLRDHINKLRLNKNNCGIVQNAWNKYGEENFEFIVLEYVENEEKLIEKEQYYLDTLKPHYNIRKVAESNRGVKRTPEALIKFSISNSKPVIQYDLEGNFIKEWKSVKSVANSLNVSAGTVSGCCNGNQKTCKGFILKFKDNHIEYKGSKHKRKFTDEEFKEFKINRTAKQYKIHFNGKTITITNLKKFCDKVGIKHKTVLSYFSRCKTDFYKTKYCYYEIERLDKLYI